MCCFRISRSRHLTGGVAGRCHRRGLDLVLAERSLVLPERTIVLAPLVYRSNSAAQKTFRIQAPLAGITLVRMLDAE